MPIIRKVCKIGNSKGIIIPKSWFDFYERKTQVKITEVTIEVNDVLTIRPILPQQKTQTSNM